MRRRQKVMVLAHVNLFFLGFRPTRDAKLKFLSNPIYLVVLWVSLHFFSEILWLNWSILWLIMKLLQHNRAYFRFFFREITYSEFNQSHTGAQFLTEAPIQFYRFNIKQLNFFSFRWNYRKYDVLSVYLACFQIWGANDLGQQRLIRIACIPDTLFHLQPHRRSHWKVCTTNSSGKG
jgi:hypothetical protein